MADEKQTFKLDLDTKEFLEKALGAKSAIGDIADAKSLSGLTEGLLGASKVIGILGAAAFAFKGALDLTLEAESIQRVNRQFEILAGNVGVSATKLRSDLVKAMRGLADEEDVLLAANRAMVMLGDQTARLGQFMELARKATAVFGGDLVENFEKISSAIGTGNTRALRSLGLFVDSERAVLAYARATNQTASALTEAERRQAIANAVLEKGRETLKGAIEDQVSAGKTIKEIGIGIKDFYENIAELFNRLFGDKIRAVLITFKDALKEVNLAFKETFGEGADRAAAHAERLKGKIAEVEEQLKTLQEQQGTPLSFPVDTAQIDFLQTKLQQLKVDLAATQAEIPEEKDSGVAAEAAVKISEGEAAKKLAIKTKFEQDLIALRMERLRTDEEMGGNELAFDQLIADQKLLLQQKLQTDIALLDAQVKAGQLVQDETYFARLAELKAINANQLAAIDADYFDRRAKFLEADARMATGVQNAFTKGWKAAGASATKNIADFSNMGRTAFNAFSNHAAGAFMALGSGTKSASEAMKGFLFGALADIAEAQGKIMLAQGFLGNFAAAAAGAGLMALAGFLRSQASGMTTMISGAGGAGAETPSYGFVSQTPGVDMLDQQAEKKPTREVTIQIMGHYLDTEGSRRALMEMIRQETDATAFKYVEIGQGA